MLELQRILSTRVTRNLPPPNKKQGHATRLLISMCPIIRKVVWLYLNSSNFIEFTNKVPNTLSLMSTKNMY